MVDLRIIANLQVNLLIHISMPNSSIFPTAIASFVTLGSCQSTICQPDIFGGGSNWEALDVCWSDHVNVIINIAFGRIRSDSVGNEYPGCI